MEGFTVQTLIQQNKTLACKIVAHSKKINSLHNSIINLNLTNSELVSENLNLKNEVTSKSEQILKLTQKTERLRIELTDIEKNFALAYSDKKLTLPKKTEDSYKRYLERINRWVKPYVKRISVQNKELKKRNELNARKINELKTNIESLTAYIKVMSQNKNQESTISTL